MGLIDRLPRLISAQAEGCCPINRAVVRGGGWEPMEENTFADSIAVGVPRNGDKALMAIRESRGPCGERPPTGRSWRPSSSWAEAAGSLVSRRVSLQPRV